ncbi:MAG: TSUP family transporter, partial [Elioraea tepidiphila]
VIGASGSGKTTILRSIAGLWRPSTGRVAVEGETWLDTAAGIALPLLCAMDVSGLKAWWGKWDKREMRVLIPGALVGILAGALAFRFMSDRAILGMVGITTLLFLARTLWLSRHREAPPPAPHDPLKGGICAAASGFTSTIAHAGSPPLAIYLYPRRLERQAMAATTVVFFGIV